MGSPSVASVVIITRNRARVLEDCLRHLSRQTRPADEIIVVDSSSNEETVELLRRWPEVRCIRIVGARNNMPQARNAGIAQARGDVVAFIDDDCMVSDRWLSEMLAGYDAPDVGGVGGRVVDSRLLTPRESRVGVINPDGTLVRNFASPDASERDVDWLAGGNMSFTREALAASGGFDPRYAGDNSYEEVDHAVRVTRAGYRLRFVPDASIVHLAVQRGEGDVPRDHMHPRKRFYQARNETHFCLQTFGLRRPVIGRYAADARGLTAYTVRNLSGHGLLVWLATFLGWAVGLGAWIRSRVRPHVPSA